MKLPSLFNPNIIISPEFIILKNFSLFNKSKILGFSFWYILFEDKIWLNFFWTRSRTTMKELEIYNKYFPPGNIKKVKWFDQFDAGGIPLIKGYVVFNCIWVLLLLKCFFFSLLFDICIFVKNNFYLI